MSKIISCHHQPLKTTNKGTFTFEPFHRALGGRRKLALPPMPPSRRCASRSSRRREEGRQNSCAAPPLAHSRLLRRLLGRVLDAARAGGSLALRGRSLRRRWRHLRATVVRQRSRRHEQNARGIARGGGAARVWHRLRRRTGVGVRDHVGRGRRRLGVPVNGRNSAGDRARRAGGEEGEGDARARVIFHTVGGEGAVACSAARFSWRTKFGAWDSAEPLPLENIYRARGFAAAAGASEIAPRAAYRQLL